MCVTESKMFIKSGTFMASANLIDSKYINYNKIIPSADDITLSISCNKKDLIRKVDMAGFINKTSKDSNGMCNIGIKIGDEGFGEGCLSIVSYKSASNKQNSEISVVQEYGNIPKDFCVWVDYKNVLDVLKNFTTEKIFMDFIDSNSPFIIKDKDRENYLTLLMPQARKG
jgi:DNA polymerase III sliding clamp (beta) subunit (PCNA family)